MSITFNTVLCLRNIRYRDVSGVISTLVFKWFAVIILTDLLLLLGASAFRNVYGVITVFKCFCEVAVWYGCCRIHTELYFIRYHVAIMCLKWTHAGRVVFILLTHVSSMILLNRVQWYLMSGCLSWKMSIHLMLVDIGNLWLLLYDKFKLKDVDFLKNDSSYKKLIRNKTENPLRSINFISNSLRYDGNLTKNAELKITFVYFFIPCSL
jgi:hypothetical protein